MTSWMRSYDFFAHACNMLLEMRIPQKLVKFVRDKFYKRTVNNWKPDFFKYIVTWPSWGTYWPTSFIIE